MTQGAWETFLVKSQMGQDLADPQTSQSGPQTSPTDWTNAALTSVGENKFQRGLM